VHTFSSTKAMRNEIRFTTIVGCLISPHIFQNLCVYIYLCVITRGKTR